jgi:hypothetical protein
MPRRTGNAAAAQATPEADYTITVHDLYQTARLTCLPDLPPLSFPPREPKEVLQRLSDALDKEAARSRAGCGVAREFGRPSV